MTAPSPAARHEITIVDGRFMHATCLCGWRSAGKRERKAVRLEADDHLRLYAEGAPGVALELPRPATTV
jgi:hypothetical protein